MLFDLILIGLFIIALHKGWRKGFISMVFTLIGFVLALIAAFYLRGPITEFAMTLPFAAKIATWVNDSANVITEGLASLPIFSGLTVSLTELVMQTLSIIAVFAILSLIFGLLAHLLNGIIRVLHLGAFNRIAGLALGALNGYIIVYIFAMAGLAFSAIIPALGRIVSASVIANNMGSPLHLITKIGEFFR